MAEPLRVAVASPADPTRRVVATLVTDLLDLPGGAGRVEVVELAHRWEIDRSTVSDPDLIIYDAAEIRRENSDYPLRRLIADHGAPVVAVAPDDHPELTTRALRAGAAAAVSCATSPAQLMAVLENVVRTTARPRSPRDHP